MRIGIFTDTYLPYVSGLVTSELMLKNALESLGHEVYIVTANLENFKYIKDGNIIKLSGIPIGIYDARLTGIYSISAMNEIKKWNLDIIHSQTEFGIGTFARIVSKKLDIPLVHTYHTLYEDYIHYITRGYFNRAGRKIVEYLSKFYCETTATSLIVPSRKIYNLFKQKYKVNKDINIIGTGIDIDRFDKNNFKKEDIVKLKRDLDINEKDFVIGSVSRLAKEKSIDRVIKTFEKITKKINNAKLLIVGDGPDILELMDLAKSLGLSKNVIFTGKIPIEEVQIYYQLMDLYVTFSVTETQGLTVLEAMASSIPVLAINDSSFADAVIDKKNGFLFNNDEEYLENVYKLYNDKILYKKLSENSRKLSLNHSSIEFGKQVYKVYEETIKNYKEKNFLNSIKKVVNPFKNNKKDD